MRIYHIATAADWQRAQTAGEYRAASLDTQGFIHCSAATEVPGAAQRHFAGQTGLYLLAIDPARLTAELRHEDVVLPDGRVIAFPHIYGPLNLDAVTGVAPFEPDADGQFTMPPDFG